MARRRPLCERRPTEGGPITGTAVVLEHGAQAFANADVLRDEGDAFAAKLRAAGGCTWADGGARDDH
jgi:hypothetical protein